MSKTWRRFRETLWIRKLEKAPIGSVLWVKDKAAGVYVNSGVYVKTKFGWRGVWNRGMGDSIYLDSEFFVSYWTYELDTRGLEEDVEA